MFHVLWPLLTTSMTSTVHTDKHWSITVMITHACTHRHRHTHKAKRYEWDQLTFTNGVVVEILFARLTHPALKVVTASALTTGLVTWHTQRPIEVTLASWNIQTDSLSVMSISILYATMMTITVYLWCAKNKPKGRICVAKWLMGTNKDKNHVIFCHKDNYYVPKAVVSWQATK